MASSHTNKSIFQKILSNIRGAQCLKVTAGLGTGSIVGFDFGKPLKRTQRVNTLRKMLNKNILVREHWLLVWGAAWRLTNGKRILCTSTSSNHRGGTMERSLLRLQGKLVQDIVATNAALDLVLDFGRGTLFTIFCDQANEVDRFENYILGSRNNVIVVGSKSVLSQGNKRTTKMCRKWGSRGKRKKTGSISTFHKRRNVNSFSGVSS